MSQKKHAVDCAQRPFPCLPIFSATTMAQLEHLLTGKDIKEPLISSSPHCDGLNRRVELIKDY